MESFLFPQMGEDFLSNTLQQYRTCVFFDVGDGMDEDDNGVVGDDMSDVA